MIGVCIEDAGAWLITIVTPAKNLTILLRIRFIPRSVPEGYDAVAL